MVSNFMGIHFLPLANCIACVFDLADSAAQDSFTPRIEDETI
jgi:hypothetical protein